MTEKFDISAWEKSLAEQFDSFDPQVPGEVWESMDVQLDALNTDLQFDHQLRNEFEQASFEVPADVWKGVQQNIPSNPGFFMSNWGKIATVTGIVLISALYYTSVNPVTESSSITNNEEFNKTEITGEGSLTVSGASANEETGNVNEVRPGMNVITGNDKQQVITDGLSNNKPLAGKKNERSVEQQVSGTTHTTTDTRTSGNRPNVNGYNGNFGNTATADLFHFGGDDTLICSGQSLVFRNPGLYETAEIWIDNKLKLSLGKEEKIQYKFDEAGVYSLELKLVNKNGSKSYFKKVQVATLPEISSINDQDLGEGRFRFDATIKNASRINWFIDYGYVSGKSAIERVFIDERPADHRIACIVTNKSGCRDSAVKTINNSFLVRVNPPWMANVFTPNGDGENDDFGVFIEGQTHFELYIYNSKMELVFKTSDPKEHWNGINQLSGEKCPEATYICVLRYALAGGEVKEVYNKLDLLLKK